MKTYRSRFPSLLCDRHSATKGIVIAMICTFFEAFNVPVFWPILVMYFIMLFCITMKRQIKVNYSWTNLHSINRHSLDWLNGCNKSSKENLTVICKGFVGWAENGSSI